MPPISRTHAGRRLDRLLLLALALFTLMAVAGYAVFGRDPSRLASLPQWALTFYARSFAFFALGHVIVAMAVLAVVLTRRVGARWLPAFATLYVISLSSELAGTTWGLPFGEYSYSELLAPMWLDRVPAVIPMSWFFMALPSYALAALAVPGRGARIAVSSLILLAWDLALDPAMSFATPYWTWGESGPYYGMPWLNLVGWYVTGIVLALMLALLRAERWTSRVEPRWWLGFYGVNLALPLGMCMAAGLWLAVGATAVVLAVLAASLTLAVRHTAQSAARLA
ncbi:MAG TPA: carotenoid biosynthesis protein [Longimicrobiales bacterium]|nr:carotenoid biosynthesis protein [Longimicrobiales bacterium]